MSPSANYFKLGVFVIAGVLTGLAALLLLGLGQNWKRPLMVETYLDQSVQGLEIGSKVKYRGVDLGVVHGIGFSRDRYEVGRPPEVQKSYVLIEVAIAEEAYQEAGREEFLKLLRADVARGLRFRLNALGITGLSYLELDYVDPTRYPSLPVTWTPEHLYIPSAPGTLTKLLSSVEQVFRKLEAVDLALVLTNLNRLLTTAEAEVRAAEISRISKQVSDLLTELRGSNEALQTILRDPQWRSLPSSALATLEQIRNQVAALHLEGVVARLDRTLGVAEDFLAGKEADLAATLNNLRALSENLRALSEVGRMHPAGILLGAPPKPVQPAR
jgi:paraquat-inducible protein B